MAFEQQHVVPRVANVASSSLQKRVKFCTGSFCEKLAQQGKENQNCVFLLLFVYSTEFTRDYIASFELLTSLAFNYMIVIKFNKIFTLS